MRMSGYTNPIRSFERKLAPDFAQREFRDPGLRTSGLGSLHHTMPHLQKLTTMRMQGGGALELGLPAYNPDPQFRQLLNQRRAEAGVESTAQFSRMYLERALELIMPRWRPVLIVGSYSMIRSIDRRTAATYGTFPTQAD